MDSPSSKETPSIDTITDSLTPSTTAANLHSTTSKPHPERTLSYTEPTTCPSIPSSFPLVTPSKDTDSTSPSTASATTPPSSLQATPSPTAHLPSIIKSRQPTTPVIPASFSADTQGTTISKPKIIILHHDTVIDGRRIIIRTIQNCFAAILGPNAPQPSETAILNAFAHNATLGEALDQLGAFKTPSKPDSSSAAAAEAANSDTTKSSSKDKGKGKAKVMDPSTPTQEEQQYDYQHAIALWTQAYLHYTHEFLSEFDIYPDLEPFAKQMKQQDVNVVILIAQDGFESSSSSSPEQTSSTDGDKDGKKSKKKKQQKQQQQQQPATPAPGVKIIQELMRRMGVTAAGKGARGYQGQGRQAAAVGGATAAVVVVGGIYASGIEGEAVARVWKGDILPGFITPQIAIAKEANSDGGEGNASKGTDVKVGTVAADSPEMRKDEVLFACCSKQYLGLARAIGATACWVTRCEDKTAGEQQPDIVVEDLEKLGHLVVGDMVSNGKGEESVVEARHSRQRDESGIITSEKKKQTPKNKTTTITTEDIDMPDADCNDGAAVDQKIEETQDDGSEGQSERKVASSKPTKVVKTEQVEEKSVATVAQQKESTGKKRTRDDVEEWLPVEMGGEEVPVVDLTEEP
ncbi:hypothetical protein GE21DRAFT_6025 [Neurospora crassa]|uniref:Uncharacterized protein n=1 Tax=Neurospora crassa (strain ATCC 24698 / 74-OR23-1A / CBS 708.71 / DSM 1257 / FGSC 987) TaxID=367110 RepID=Q7RYC3_NEUCR|nr:hypothetical protein NCU04484 [Neurospora crassa OR74A]EAA27817.1 hypothetical protein NCU04484 [Neurospora crassa OR74A]KHE88641.1 hypothetical protein GE21DRAFT_6025 [Neurospora crassa]|eukprot:XP_957053.1 hypothetical protein NCU04484 [Neurospora crassa OR74A]